MKNTHVICHYGEIGLKGKNRSFFEKKLAGNIEKALKLKNINASAKRISGSIVLKIDKGENINAKKALKTVPGIHHFSFAISCNPTIDNMNNLAYSLAKSKNFESFKIDTKRSDKSYPENSMEVNRKVGAFVVEKTGKKVKLNNPDLTIFIEIVKVDKKTTRALVFSEKIKGVGGLPVSSGGKALSLFSGGIDSPVASFLMNKRGVRNDFVHFHSYPFTGRESIDKAKDAISALNKFQFEAEVHLVPFADIQKKIVSVAPAPFRIVLYRRFMMRIASRIAEKQGIPVLVSGDSVGQVGSQTLENILAISDAATLPILRPLAGHDKEEIIEIAKEIGTYKISIRPCEDTCSWFLPDNPATKTSLEKIKSAEADMNIEAMVEEGLKKSSVEQLREVHRDI